MIEDAVSYIEYDGVRYKRGPIIPLHVDLVGKCCSCREYEAIGVQP